jgi:hypothetical protein
MRQCVMILAVGLVACQTSPGSGPVSPVAPKANAPRPETCIGTVAEYCQRTPTGCPMFEQTVVRRKAQCSQAGTWTVVVRKCPGVYRSVAWRETVLGGGEEYFDAKGLLAGAYLETDYGAYCSGSSSSQKFGTIPSCPTPAITEGQCAGGGA